MALDNRTAEEMSSCKLFRHVFRLKTKDTCYT